MQTSINSAKPTMPCVAKAVSLTEAKKWIGRRMILRQSWLGFAKGTLCRVMCVVDFGDGLLLWFVTDDDHARDIDQLDMAAISTIFSELPEPTMSRSSLSTDMILLDRLVSGL